ncbi:hypothetical protein GJ744_005604 [Endocarpon pusillum]|uniref:Uncharacterized protein n=1 Tax=Endocarpon pusillum TaxID=364733 RepID=A0A8H7E128_9EURO|nr:hypothetical protein GJ744_005604 [Endocarpon pusillum]
MSVRSSIWKKALLMHSLSTRELEGEELNGSSRCTAQATDPPYLADFYYVISLGNRLSRILTLCKLCNFLKRTCPNPGKDKYKLLAICTSESYLFENPKKA